MKKIILLGLLSLSLFNCSDPSNSEGNTINNLREMNIEYNSSEEIKGEDIPTDPGEATLVPSISAGYLMTIDCITWGTNTSTGNPMGWGFAHGQDGKKYSFSSSYVYNRDTDTVSIKYTWRLLPEGSILGC